MTRSYRNPPVVEALSEVFFEGSAWDPTIPGLFYDRVRDQFPGRGQRKDIQIELTVGSREASSRTTHGDPRSEFSNSDRSRLVQVGRDLLVVNQLRPYPHYVDWRPIVLDMCGVYRELAKPASIARATMRYLNRIPVPDTFQMETYFRMYPEVPPEIGGGHGAFLMRLELPALHATHRLILTFGWASPEPDSEHALMLDLYDVAPIQGADTFDGLAQTIDEAHANIERAFEGAITPELRSRFGEA
jgi:uncharacterized protein (TIGR04255 family)